MINLSGIQGKDIEICDLDINVQVITVKDMRNDITYKGRISSFYLNSEIRQSFSGEVVDISYSVDITLMEYMVLNEGKVKL